jgi:hypothetical protein
MATFNAALDSVTESVQIQLVTGFNFSVHTCNFTVNGHSVLVEIPAQPRRTSDPRAYEKLIDVFPTDCGYWLIHCEPFFNLWRRNCVGMRFLAAPRLINSHLTTNRIFLYCLPVNSFDHTE